MNQNNLLNDLNDYSIELPATVGQRLANYLIDTVVMYIFMFVAFVILGTLSYLSAANEILLAFTLVLMIFIVIFGYYILFEGSAKGKTVGKMLSKTRVVGLDGQPISYSTAFIRTLIRMIPFEFLSVFMGGQMWHDKWTNTKLIQG